MIHISRTGTLKVLMLDTTGSTAEQTASRENALLFDGDCPHETEEGGAMTSIANLKVSAPLSALIFMRGRMGGVDELDQNWQATMQEKVKTAKGIRNSSPSAVRTIR